MAPDINPFDSADEVVVLYHGGCPDGFGAAWSAWRALGDRVTLIPYHHGDPIDARIQGRPTLMFDCAYPRAMAEQAASMASEFFIIDHHRSAFNDCGDLPFARFDMARSGAGLAWDFFHPGQPRPALITHVEDRDLWRFASSDTRAFCSRLDSEPMSLAAWDPIGDLSGPALLAFIREGQLMSRQFEAQCEQLLEGAIPVSFMGARAWALNATKTFASQCGALLCERPGTDLALIWSSPDLQTARLSLRSRPGFNCAELAEKLGGGGHPQAAGASVALADLPSLLTPRIAEN